MAQLGRGVTATAVLFLVSFGGCETGECPKVDDENPCTAEVCEGGKTVFQPLPDGSICHAGARTGTCKSEVCVIPCESAADCDDKNACTVDDCLLPSHTCANLASSALLPTSDGNACTKDMCLSGTPIYVPVPGGTPCGKGTCEAGICSVCSTEADCGKDTDCLKWKCDQGTCVQTHLAKGSVAPSISLLGDCKYAACDGWGGVVEILQASDPPLDDGNPCTKEICKGFTPVHEVLPSGSFCPGGVCRSDGECVECLSDLHCQGLHCFQNTCFSCENGIPDGDETAVDCGGSCKGCLGEPCAQGSDCQSGFCADGVCCTSSCGTCMTCNAPGTIGQCKLVPKYDEDPPSCTINASKSMCTGTGQCKTALGFPCIANPDCASFKCSNGVCIGP